MSITTLVFQDFPQGYVFSSLRKLLSALSPSRISIEFSVKPVYPTMVGAESVVLRLLENVFVGQQVERRLFYLFYSWPPKSKSTTRFLSSRLQAEGILLFPQAVFFVSLFPFRRNEGTMKVMQN